MALLITLRSDFERDTSLFIVRSSRLSASSTSISSGDTLVAVRIAFHARPSRPSSWDARSAIADTSRPFPHRRRVEPTATPVERSTGRRRRQLGTKSERKAQTNTSVSTRREQAGVRVEASEAQPQRNSSATPAQLNSSTTTQLSVSRARPQTATAGRVHRRGHCCCFNVRVLVRGPFRLSRSCITINAQSHHTSHYADTAQQSSSPPRVTRDVSRERQPCTHRATSACPPNFHRRPRRSTRYDPLDLHSQNTLLTSFSPLTESEWEARSAAATAGHARAAAAATSFRLVHDHRPAVVPDRAADLADGANQQQSNDRC